MAPTPRLPLRPSGSLKEVVSLPTDGTAITMYPHEARYELLDTTSGEYCATEDEIKRFQRYKSHDPNAIGHGVMFEGAKLNAIGKLPGADGLVEIRTKVEQRRAEECVTVIGRGYKLIMLRAVGSGGGDGVLAPGSAGGKE